MTRTKTAAALLLACLALTAAIMVAPTASTAGPNPAVALTAVPLPSVSVVPRTPAPGTPWYGAGCATGSFGTARVEQGHLLVPATVTLCGTWSSKYKFTIVSFDTVLSFGVASSTRLRPYAPSGATEMTADFASPPAPGWPIGLCLMRSIDDRLACVRVEGTTVTPIPPADPLVAEPVFYDGFATPETTTPFCGTCLIMPR